jgi:hypothetical protein
MNIRAAYYSVAGLTLVLGLTLSTAAFSQNSANPSSDTAKPPSTVQAGTALTKQHVDGGDLTPDTQFQEKYQKQPTPSSR